MSDVKFRIRYLDRSSWAMPQSMPDHTVCSIPNNLIPRTSLKESECGRIYTFT